MIQFGHLSPDTILQWNRRLMRNNLLRFVVVAPLFYLAVPSNSMATDFATPQSYAVGAQPVAIVTGDFNGDGKPDLAVVSWRSNELSILINNGDGAFNNALNSPLGSAVTSTDEMALATADFNGDGKLD